MRRAHALKTPSRRPQVAEDGFHPWSMPKIALVLVFAATAIIVVLAATVLGNVVLPAFKLRPDLLAGLMVVAGIGLTAGLALLEWSPSKALQAP
jgi:peptidoglycan/LPS O-acetylase OafA/YrhL